MSSEAFYLKAVTHASSLPPALETAATRWALTNLKHNHAAAQVLVALCSRSTILPETDKAIGRVSAAPVKAAWLSRPGRPTEVLSALIKKEKRATVLASVASSENVSLDVLTALASDPRPTVVSAVLASSKATREIKVTALVNAASAASSFSSYESSLTMKSLITSLPEAHEGIALSSEIVEAFTNIPFEPLSAEALERAAQILVFDRAQEATSKVRGYYYGGGVPSEVLSAALRLVDAPNLDDEKKVEVAQVALSLVAAADAAGANRHNSRNFITDEDRLRLKMVSGDQEERALAAREAAAAAERMRIAQSSQDPAELEKVAEFAIDDVTSKNPRGSYHNYVSPLVNPLLLNPYLPEQKVLALLTVAPHNNIPFPAIFSAHVAKDATGEALVFAARLALHFYYLPDNLPDLVDDFETLVSNYVDLLAVSNDYAKETKLRQLITSPRLVTPRTIRAVPASIALSLASDPVIKIISDVLGSDQANWEVFEVLSEGFTGSFGELVDAAAAL